MSEPLFGYEAGGERDFVGRLLAIAAEIEESRATVLSMRDHLGHDGMETALEAVRRYLQVGSPGRGRAVSVERLKEIIGGDFMLLDE